MLVPIVSPSYLSSRPCGVERDAFVSAAGRSGGLIRDNKSRIVKVAKTPVDRAEHPPEFRDLLEHKFFVELPSGEAREFLLHEDEEVRRRYGARVDDVAREITRILQMLDQAAARTTARGVIFLAEATSDLEDARDRIRRALEQRGYDVLPSHPLPLLAPRLVEAVAADVAKAQLCVHLVGAHFGLIPEQADGRSLPRLQLEATALADRPVARVIWIPEALTPADENQRAFLDEVRRQYPALGFEVIESTLQKLETHLRDRLEPPQKVIAPREPNGDAMRVYVMCDMRDRDGARTIRKTLLARGFEVDFPPESGEPAEVRELHQERLREDEAFVIYYGQSPDVWVQRQLGELRKAPGLGRREPIRARRVFLAEPSTPDKEDLLANANLVLNGLSGAEAERALEPLLRELAAGSPPAGGSLKGPA